MDQDARLKERQRYVDAFNDTMVQIWKEKIVLLEAVNRGKKYPSQTTKWNKSLLESVVGVRTDTDDKILDITLEQSFNVYGIYVDSGTGKEVPRGERNGGDIGRDKVRKAKPWFFKKHLASLYNLREFMAENTGQEIADAISNALSGRVARRFAINNP